MKKKIKNLLDDITFISPSQLKLPFSNVVYIFPENCENFMVLEWSQGKKNKSQGKKYGLRAKNIKSRAKVKMPPTNQFNDYCRCKVVVQ